MTASNPWCGAHLKAAADSRVRRWVLRPWLQTCVAWTLAAWFGLAQSHGHLVDTPRPTESQVEAIYLYNFAKFVTWPQDQSAANAPMTICLDHADSFVPTLQDEVSGEMIDGRSIAIRRISSATEEAGCNILYIDSSDAANSQALLAVASSRSVLTVSDIRGFANDGGIIEFMREGSRVRFKVDLAEAQKAGLGLSSQLLKVAKSVSGSRVEGDAP
ncbi:MAG: YfiR family protein [Acidobacteriaceae bacterium]